METKIFTGHEADIAAIESATITQAELLEEAHEELIAAIDNLAAESSKFDELFDGREPFDKRAARARRRLENYITLRRDK